MKKISPKIFSKDTLIEKLRAIRARNWVPNARQGNVGGVGNTLEDLLGIKENNLPIPNAAEWELKCQRADTSALITLFHMEPSPRALNFVPTVLLPKYGWAHQEAGKKYGKSEMSFRQTIHGQSRSDRGFMVQVDRKERKILISFNPADVAMKHFNWLEGVGRKIALKELDPQPYWGFDDLFHKAGIKMLNCFFVQAEVKKEHGKEFFRYTTILMLQKFSLEKFIDAIERGDVLVDFDARTGHNHGTKFRLRQDAWPKLYSKITEL